MKQTNKSNKQPKLWDKRTGDRVEMSAEGQYVLFSSDGKVLNQGSCYVDNISSNGAGLRVTCPFFRGDQVSLTFRLGQEPYQCKGTVVRDISWSRKTGIYVDDWEVAS